MSPRDHRVRHDGSPGQSSTASGTALDGRARFRYADSTGQLTALTTGANLHWYDVSSGCLGLVNSGDPAALGVTYNVTPEQDITSP